MNRANGSWSLLASIASHSSSSQHQVLSQRLLPGGFLGCRAQQRVAPNGHYARVSPDGTLCKRCHQPVPTRRRGDRRYCTQTCADTDLPRTACETCGAGIVSRHGRVRQFCSRACRHSPGRETRNCARCGAPFSVKRSAPHLYCGRTCRIAARSEQVTGPNPTDRRPLNPPATCLTCGTQFPARYGEDNLFCSWACRRLPYCVACTVLIDADRRRTDRQFCSDDCATAHAADPNIVEKRRRCWFCLTMWHADSFGTGQGVRHRCPPCAEQYRAARRADFKARNAARRASLESRTIPFTPAQRAARWAMWAARCWMCGVADASEEDHVKPVSKGGWHCLSNLRPVCGSCNSSKQDRWPLTGDQLRPNFRHPDARPGADPGRPKPAILVDLTCPHCRNVFTLRAGDARGRIFCGPRCARAARRGERTTYEDRRCIACGATFRVRTTSQQRLCSTTCRGLARRRALHQFTCERCGQPFERRNKGFRFCSKSCATRTNTHSHTCPVCGDTFLGKDFRRFCSQRCAGIASHWVDGQPPTKAATLALALGER